MKLWLLLIIFSSAFCFGQNPLIGSRNLLVVPVNYSDKKVEPAQVAQMKYLIAQSNKYFNEVSYSQFEFSVDFISAGKVQVSRPAFSCESVTMKMEVQSILENIGIEHSQYDYKLYFAPKGSCLVPGLRMRDTIFIHGESYLNVVAHELGHLIGAKHARAVECSNGVLSGNCDLWEYGNMFDIMGVSAGATNLQGAELTGHFSVASKEFLGWLNTATTAPIIESKENGIYTIAALEENSLRPKGIKVLRNIEQETGTKTFFYIEFRAPIGFDAFIDDDQRSKKGIILYLVEENNPDSINLLDMTPETSFLRQAEKTGKYQFDGTLQVGQQFFDEESCVTIKHDSITEDNNALIDIKHGC
jgi:hypothetical protein